ncbi:MAG: hypothetical protein HYR72_09310 [Deltaproteobacteria bacterium]|nr:hypothetical protein [Deltaproteobacteria bacterium]
MSVPSRPTRPLGNTGGEGTDNDGSFGPGGDVQGDFSVEGRQVGTHRLTVDLTAQLA